VKDVEVSYTQPDTGVTFGVTDLPDEYSKSVIGYLEFKLNGFRLSPENLKKA
jgi:hypothetical protein